MKPIAIDLFAGAGFMGHGFMKAGFDVRVAVEINPSSCDFHQRNFPDTKVICEDIRQVDSSQITAAAGTSKIDVVFGGPSCQGWSVQGHNSPDDPRRALAYEFVRIVDEIRPQHFVFENVKGLTLGKNKAPFEALLQTFQAIGYRLTPWKILNAADYGVSQSRERLFLLGSRAALPLIPYPEPTGRITCKDVLEGIPAHLTGQEKVKHSAKVVARFRATPWGKREPISRFHRLHPDGLAPTLLAGTPVGKKGGRYTAKRPIHYAHHIDVRVLTGRELARVHGIDDDIDLSGSKCDVAMWIGNSVPPPLAKAVAQQVVKVIEGFRP